jgi:predicted AlkP superfamily pyrophosphatase or phosphodiesterase
MIYHEDSAIIRAQKSKEGFLHPWYGHRSIAEIGPTIIQRAGGTPTRPALDLPLEKDPAFTRPKCVLLLVDGLGFDHFVKYAPRFPFLHALSKQGHVHPLTSVFPSTTSAALTTLHTGVTPQEHGLPEWNVYFEEFESIIQTLPFKKWAMREADGLLTEGGHANMLYEGPTVYSELASLAVPSYVFVAAPYATSAYTTNVQKGATIVPFHSGPQLMEQLKNHLESVKGPAYFFVYWSSVDGTAHAYGPDSPQHIQAIQEFDTLIWEHLLPSIDKSLLKEILLLLTADHGHVNIKREDIINLNKFPELEENFQTTRNGQKILPTGSPHDVFLFIKPERRDEIVYFLQRALDSNARILTIDTALSEGLFGLNKVSPKFRRRIGNVLILPRRGSHIWYEFFPNEVFSMLGIHGGLSEEEMLVPFASCAPEKLRK